MLVGSAAAGAFAQSPGDAGKWEIEVHAGGVRTGNPTDATTAMPAAGEPFTTVNGRPAGPDAVALADNARRQFV